MRNANVAARSAVTAAIGFGGYAIYQLALAAGAPLGRGAWGGTHTELPTSLRLASVASIAFYALAALLVLRRAGFSIRWISGSVARTGTWVLAVVLMLSALGNLLSGSPWERYLNGPVGLVLALLCLIVARSPQRSWRPPSEATPRRRKAPVQSGRHLAR